MSHNKNEREKDTRKKRESGNVEEMLKEMLTLVAVTSNLAVEFEEKDLVSSILDVALKVTNTDAGSIFMVDEEKEELYFSVVKGGKADKLKGYRLPMGKGIAGYVAQSGQPLCVSNVQESDFFDPAISNAIEYETRSILAVPMIISDRVIGVLEVLNKEGDRFSKNDIEFLLTLSEQAGKAIAGNRLSTMIYKLFVHIVKKSMDEKIYDKIEKDRMLLCLKEVIENLESSEEYKNIMEMTSLLVKISKFGPLKQEACIKSLKNFKAYVEKELEMDPFSNSL